MSIQSISHENTIAISTLRAVLASGVLAAALAPIGCLSTSSMEETDGDLAVSSQALVVPNLALGKPTSQSSTYTGSLASAVSSSAVDGNTDGNWMGASVTHTNNEAQPWWQVDLQSSQSIGNVVLWNRTDCCSERLSNFNLLVSDDGATWQAYPYAGVAPAQLTFAVNRSARYVKVQLAGTNPLSLAEVQVFPPTAVMGNARCNDLVRLKSWKGDYLNRPDTSQGVTTDNANVAIGNEWIVECKPDGNIQLRSWKGDYLHRPDSPQGVTTWDQGEWTVVPVSGTNVMLRSWKGDYLHRPDSPQGVTTWDQGTWTVEVAGPNQVSLDGTSYVTLTPWANQTDLPAGTKIAIRLRKVMTDYYGNSVAWPKWIGVSTADNQTIDAVDVALTSRNVFTAQVFHPAGQQYYDLPWYVMLASNGQYVGGSNDGTAKLVAKYSLPDAGLFGRGWNGSQASQFLLEPYPWSQAQYWLDQVKAVGNYHVYCASPFTLGTAHITQWLNGGYPNYGCYVSGDVDYFIVN